MFCKHKYGKVDGKYQYCEKCGESIEAPWIGCNHRWVIINTITNNLFAIKYIMKCEECGELKSVEIK